MRFPPSKRSRYEESVAAHGDGLVKLAYAICGDRGRAEDAVQEALTRVYQRWSRLNDPLAYARRTAINATRDDWRRSVRSQRAHHEAARLLPIDGDDPHERFVANSALMAAGRAAARSAGGHRAALRQPALRSRDGRHARHHDRHGQEPDRPRSRACAQCSPLRSRPPTQWRSHECA